MASPRAFESLRLNSTAALVEMSRIPAMRAEMAEPTAVQVRLTGPVPAERDTVPTGAHDRNGVTSLSFVATPHSIKPT